MVQQQFVTTGPVSATPEQMAKLRSELDIVQVNLTVLRELIAQMKPPNNAGTAQPQPPEDFHFVQVFYSKTLKIFLILKHLLKLEKIKA